MTEKQREFIEGMNEFCTKKCLLDADVKMLTTKNKQ